MLNHPYPVPVFHSHWRSTISIALFVSLFLLIFQPFGLNEFTGSNKYLFIAGYGLVTFVILSFDNMLLRAVLRTKKSQTTWTVKKQILLLTLILFTIGVGNFFYSALLLQFHNLLIGFLMFQFFTVAVGILPVIIITILNENIKSKAFLKQANTLNVNIPSTHKTEELERTICLTDDSEKIPFVLPISNFLFAESTGNYLKIYYIKDNKVKSTLLRTTLTKAESQLESHSDIMKCHRAFLVNIENIEQVKGNAQGLRLQLKHTDEEIPVSRNYTKDLRDKIQS